MCHCTGGQESQSAEWALDTLALHGVLPEDIHFVHPFVQGSKPSRQAA